MRNKTKIGIILLARCGATRLPGKVLLEICGKPMIEQILRRLEKVNPCDELVVATTINSKDDPIVELCESLKIAVFRGSEDNVLDRCIQAAKANDLDIVIRLGADNPLIDWEVINDMLRIFLEERGRGNHLDYMSNALDRSFPVGLDVEIFDKDTFVKIYDATRKMSEGERVLNEINVIPYLHQNRDLFNIFSYKKDFDYSNLRWTVDTPEDFDLIVKIYEALYPKKEDFHMRDILGILEKYPDWVKINSKVIPKSGYWTEAEKEKLANRLDGI